MKHYLLIILALIGFCCVAPRTAHATACSAGCVQYLASNVGTGTTITLTLTGVVAGHAVHAWYCWDPTSASVSGVTVGGSAATLGTATIGNGSFTCGFAYYWNTTAGSNAVVITTTCVTNCTDILAIAEEWAGDITTGSPIDGQNGTFTSGTTLSGPVPCGNITMAANNDTIETFNWTASGTGPETAPSGYAIAANVAVFGQQPTAYKAGNTSGTVNPTWTSITAGNSDLVLCAAFKQTGGGGGAQMFRSMMGVGK